MRLTYAPESGHEWETEVDPWAVVVRHGRWYLLCHSHRADAVRTYRIDRIRRVEHTAGRFRPPQDLDPVQALEENLGAGWDFATRVRFDAPLAEVAPWIRPPMGRLEASGDGCVLVGSTRNPTMYASEWLAGDAVRLLRRGWPGTPGHGRVARRAVHGRGRSPVGHPLTCSR